MSAGSNPGPKAPVSSAGPAKGPETLVRPVAKLGETMPPLPANADGLPSGEATTSEGTGEGGLIGSMVGSFKLMKLLGRGGMGSVYLGEHPAIGSRVAIKFLHEMLASNAELVRRFYDEARAVNLIGHENIVTTYDLNQLGPRRYYFVMEYLEGVTLGQRLEQGPLDLAQSVKVLTQLADALHAAHQRGVVHRDLKPDNVFLVKRGTNPLFVKLVDFGIAKLKGGDEPQSQTRADVLVGTPEYMSPEQADHRPVDARSDLYSLGVIAYRLSTGRLPFVETTAARTMVAHVDKAPQALRSLVPTLPVAWEAAVLKALSKRPEERFPDALAFAEALERALTVPAPAPTPARSPIQAATANAVARPGIPVRPGGAAAPTQARPAAPGSSAATAESPALAPKPAPAAAAPVAAPTPAEPVQPPTPTTDRARHSAGFEVDVVGTHAGHYLAGDVSRGGMFLCSEGQLPPLFSRLEFVLAPGSKSPLQLVGEVVRHVSPSEARAWGMQPGFGIQFSGLSPEQKTALGTMVGQLPQAPRPAPAPAAAPPAGAAKPARIPTGAKELETMLEFLRHRLPANAYDFFDLPPECDSAQVRAAAQKLTETLDALLKTVQPGSHHSQLEAGLERVQKALDQLTHPAKRFELDAQRGNWQGIGRAIDAGLKESELAVKRAAWVAQRPGTDERVQLHLGRVKVARGRGNHAAALKELQLALSLDPLNADLHRAYKSLQKLTPGV